VTNKDRFDRPETITDVCQGLGWWMEGNVKHSLHFLQKSDTFTLFPHSFL
jgi:hypothetical protein